MEKNENTKESVILSNEVKDRNNIDGWHSFTLINISTPLSEGTRIKSWCWYARNLCGVKFQIYRRMNNNSFKLIGENVYYSSREGINLKNVPNKEQLVAKEGDYVGWTFIGPQSCIPFSGNEKNFSLVWGPSSNHRHCQVGEEMNFPGGGNRNYSFCAYVEGYERNSEEVIGENEIKNRRKIDSWFSFSLVNISKTFMNGVIQSIVWYARNNGSIKFQVYRHIEKNAYKLVGETKEINSRIGINLLNLPDELKISVMEGDHLGWTFLGQKACVPFDEEEDSDILLHGPNCEHPKPIVDMPFEFPVKIARTYSICAFLEGGLNEAKKY